MAADGLALRLAGRFGILVWLTATSARATSPKCEAIVSSAPAQGARPGDCRSHEPSLGDSRLEDLRERRLAYLYQLVGGLADRVPATDQPR
jgi:hypothetical protein